MSRVLWLADGGATTGFGTVTHAIGDRLVQMGHDVHCLAANHTGDYFPTRIKLYRANSKDQMDQIGKSRVLEILAAVMPDVVVILNDLHVMTRLLFHNPHDPDRILLRLRPIIGYLPVDGLNLPPAWMVMTKFMRPVAMSRFGAQQLGVPDMIHHGIETDIYRPATRENPITLSNNNVITSKREAKEAFDFDPDRFLILRVDRNSWRKDFGSTWQAIVPLMHQYDDIDAYFHCQGNDPAGGPIFPAMWTRDPATMERFQLPNEKNYSTFRGWPASDLAGLYNAADLFVSTSMGEGFGMTLAEAMACEVPVIAQRHSAVSEVVGDGGILIEPGPVITAPAGQDLRLANVEAFSHAIEKLYLDASERRLIGRRARRHVLRNFNWDDKALAFDQLIRTIHQASLEVGSDPKEAIEEAVASV